VDKENQSGNALLTTFMATKKKSSTKRSSSGSDPKSKRIVKNKMGEAMHEFKHHELESGRSGRKVKNPKQAIAIGLSEARRSGADIPAAPGRKRSGSKRSGSATKKTAAKRAPAKKAAAKRPAKKTAPRKRATKKTASRKRS
jgi:hypothetical protein